jgi:hypothetical protein
LFADEGANGALLGFDKLDVEDKFALCVIKDERELWIIVVPKDIIKYDLDNNVEANFARAYSGTRCIGKNGSENWSDRDCPSSLDWKIIPRATHEW